MQRIGEIYAAFRRLRHYGDDHDLLDRDGRRMAKGRRSPNHILAPVVTGTMRRHKIRG